MNKDIIIGVDLGGTKIMTGAIDSKGKVLCEPVKVPTLGHEPSDKIIKRITDSVETILQKLKSDIRSVQGIGIGSTGPLDYKTGKILECPQLPTMNNFPLRKVIADYFSVPVFLNNDANCLIYAETIFGKAAGKKNVLGYTLGTGIGCAIILNKKILNGATGSAGEIWISPYQENIIEDYISGNGVMKIYKSISGNEKTSLEIFQLAKEGDINALKTWEEFGKHLAVPIAWGINFIDPEIVVLGGSITKAQEYFMPYLEEKLQNLICPVPANKTSIVLAGLGDYAGFIGAACLVIENNISK